MHRQDDRRNGPRGRSQQEFGIIRPALPTETSCVERVVEAAYEIWISRLGRKPAPMEDDYERRVVAHQLWVLELDDVIIGVMVLEDHETSLFIENVAVHPAWQGRGFGIRLMTFAEEEALRRGYYKLHLCTSELMTENIARYRHLGFRETSRIPGRSSLRVCMAKHVSR